MKTIIFIGAQKSGSSREAIGIAGEMGYFTVLLTNRQSFLDKRAEFPDVQLMLLCDLNNYNGIRDQISCLTKKALEIAAIISFVDGCCDVACLLAEEFGVNHFSKQAVINMEDKIRSRQVLSHSPYTPRFQILPVRTATMQQVDAGIKANPPFVLKAPKSAGSKDVYVVNNEAEFDKYVTVIKRRYPDLPVLIEEYLDEPQYLVETIAFKKEIHIIAVLRQEITYSRRFIVTGYSLQFNLPDNFLKELKEAVESILRVHGMETGACHLEMRYARNNWKLIECNPRISGGGMNRLIEHGLGINLVRETLKIALGQEPHPEATRRRHVFAKYITVSETGALEKVTGRKKASQCLGVKEIYVKPRKGALLHPPLSMGHRYAYVIAVGQTEQAAQENAKFAASQIQFHQKPPGRNNNGDLPQLD